MNQTSLTLCRRSLLVAMVIALGSCRQSNTLVVRLTAIPAEASSLQVRWRLEDQPEQVLTPALALGDFPARGEATFGLRLPDGYMGRVVIAAATFQDSCLLATGTIDGTGGTKAELALALQKLAPKDCSGNALAINAVVPLEGPAMQPLPILAGGGKEVRVLGWGFQKDAEVQINGITTQYLWVSSAELKITKTPPRGATPLAKPVPLVVNTPRARAERSDLLRYYADKVTFGAANRKRVPNAPEPYAVLADLRHAGTPRQLDLIVSGSNDPNDGCGISIFRNDGTGTFSDTPIFFDTNCPFPSPNPVDPTYGSVVGRIIAAHYNDDDFLDLALTMPSGSFTRHRYLASIVLNDKIGNFLTPQRVPETARGYGSGFASFVISANLDGLPGEELLVTAAQGNSSIETYAMLQSNKKTFQRNDLTYVSVRDTSGELTMLHSSRFRGRSGVFADLLGDGKGTLIFSSCFEAAPDQWNIPYESYTVADSRSNVVFSRNKSIPSPLLKGDYAQVYAPDLNRDGTADLVLVGSSKGTDCMLRFYGQSVQIFLNKRGGTFTDPLTVAGLPDGLSITSVNTADIDGDGWQDLIIGDGVAGASRLLLVRNNRDGSFSVLPSELKVWDSSVTRDGAWSIATDDANGDGLADIVVAGRSSTSPEGVYSIFLNTSN